MRRLACLGLLSLVAGCFDPATSGPIASAAPPPPTVDMHRDATTPRDAERPDAGTDAAPDASPDASVQDAALDAAPPDPCVASDRRPHLELGPGGAGDFVAWEADAGVPLIRLAQGGSVTRFDLLAVDVDAPAEGLTVQVVDLDADQEIAFGESGALMLPCRPGVGRLLVDRTIDYSADLAADALLGRRVRIIATLHTAAGAVFGGAEGVLEPAR